MCSLAYKIMNNRFLVTKIEHIKWFSKDQLEMFSRVNTKKRTPASVSSYKPQYQNISVSFA